MTAYIINTARAISETVDNETIIINLDTGNYYSVNESATVIWKELEKPQTLSSLTAFTENIYAASEDTIKTALQILLDFLVKEQLILETTAAVTTEQLTNTTKKPFIAPVIDKYDDMQEMLLADPIHDVDDSGWPKLK